MKLMTLVVCLLLPAAALAAEPLSLIRITPEQQRAIGIETAPLQATNYHSSPLLPAKVSVPNAQLQVITAPQGGLVEALLVSEGEAVAAGAPLLRIQSPSLLDLESDYLESRTRLALARQNYERDRQLHAEGIIAERRLLETHARYQELSTTVTRLQRLLELAGLDEAAFDALEQQRELSGTLVVRAPFEGVVLEQLVTLGTRVAAADALYRFARLKPLWLEIHVPLEQLGGDPQDRQVVVDDPPLRARIINVGSMVHGADQGVMIRAEVDEGSERLRPGQFVQARLATVAAAGDQFRLPREAVIRRKGATYVFAARAGGFEPVAATLVAEEPDHLVIRAPLASGTEIAVRGAAALKAAWLGGED
jgi:RND family efflux transporter MFP subunit